jgi:predicted AAA+ superfamily ATPase
MTNITKTTFRRDFFRGNMAEKLVLTDIMKTYPKAYLVPGNHKEFDIMIPETGATIEVKYDERAIQTEKYFFELSNNGEPSGLSATKADYCVIVDKEYIIWIDTMSLKWWLRTSCKTISMRTKDNTIMECYLLNRDSLLLCPCADIRDR